MDKNTMNILELIGQVLRIIVLVALWIARLTMRETLEPHPLLYVILVLIWTSLERIRDGQK